jgi:hypothetical protein
MVKTVITKIKVQKIKKFESWMHTTVYAAIPKAEAGGLWLWDQHEQLVKPAQIDDRQMIDR